MQRLETKEVVRLAVICVLAVIFFITKGLSLISEQASYTFGVSLVIFIWGILCINLYKWLKYVADDLKKG